MHFHFQQLSNVDQLFDAVGSGENGHTLNLITFSRKSNVNFMDHTKNIMCPLMAAGMYVDENKNFCPF
jgi:hypothetical protein